MPQSLAQIYVHIVFSTKNRRPWLRDANLRDQLYAYMATVFRDNDDSTAFFAVSASLVDDVKKYIQNQQQHHHRMSFQDEFRELCRRHGLELDERYVWD